MSSPRSTTSALSQSLVKPVLEEKKEQEQPLPLPLQINPEFKDELEQVVQNKLHKSMVIRGEKKFVDYMEERIRQSKEGGKNLFAEINFGSEKKAQVLADPNVKAYLREKPEFKFEPVDSIHFIEHNKGIGQPDKKGKQTTPGILTLSNAEIEEIDLSEYGTSLDALIMKHGLPAIKLAMTFVLNSTKTEKTPVLAYHLISGTEQEKIDKRTIETALIKEIELALLKKHPFVYDGGDGQVNWVKISKQQGKPEVKKGRMVRNEEVATVLDQMESVTVTSLELPAVKVKQRHVRIDSKFKGLSTASNQQEKTTPDADAKIQSKTVRSHQVGDLPNRMILNHKTLPPEGSEEYLATGDKVSDHEPVVHKDKGEEITRIFSGGLSQEHPKTFQNPRDFLNDNAFVKDNQGNEVISDEYFLADIKFTGKLYALLISNCARAKIINPTEKPIVDSKAIRPENQKTSLGYMEDFYNSLATINIDPFKSYAEIAERIHFNDENQIANLTTELNKMGMRPVTSSAEMQTIFESKDKTNARRLCIALNNIGIDPFKTEQDIMSTYDSENDYEAKKLVETVNKLLQVQAVDDLDAIQEEKKQETHTLFTHELRKAFKSSFVELQDSDEFDKGYYPYAHENHVKEHGYVRKLDMVPDELRQDIEAAEKATFEEIADSILEYANAKSDTGNRSPINRLFQKAFNREVAGGFVKVANKTPNSEEVTLAVCIENAILFFKTHASGKEIIIQNITETSTKGLGKQAKNGQIGELYADTIKTVEAFYSECRRNELSQQNQHEQTQGQAPLLIYTGGNRYGSFTTPPASPLQSPVAVATVASEEEGVVQERRTMTITR